MNCSRRTEAIKRWRFPNPATLFGLTLLLAATMVQAADPWWDARWDHRCALRIAGRGATLEAVPVIIRGNQLRQLAANAPMPPASIRIVRDGREEPCQYDAFTPEGLEPLPPPAVPGVADELVFQADLPADGVATYWLYWNSTPLPPGAYPSRNLMGDPMEPDLWHHDYQLWNDQCFVCLRGPVRSGNPAANEQNNYGGGSVTYMRVLGQTVAHRARAWNDTFPRGAFASGPHPAAGDWSLPRELVRGPVRVAASCVLSNVDVGGKDAETPVNVDVVHRVWLYERGAWVCFDEIVRAHDPVPDLTLNYGHQFRFGDRTDELIWYSNADGVQTFRPTDEQLEETRRTQKVIHSTGGLNPWMAGYSTATRKGYAVIFTASAPEATEHPPIGSYTRLTTTARFARQFGPLPAGAMAAERLWVIGLAGEVDGNDPHAAWLALTVPWLDFGAVERSDR